MGEDAATNISKYFVLQTPPTYAIIQSKGCLRTMETKDELTQASKVQNDTPSANREIKDGVFKLLFENHENAAELYYTLTGTRCSPDEIKIITITTVISGNLKNDLAFVVKGKALVVGEHQSTKNENMPIRMLMYIGQLYEKWFDLEDERELLYKSKLHKIPRPEFAVFYNGSAKRPEKEILKLSSAFEDAFHDEKENFLELKVPVYNINKGMNPELFRKGETLRQYSEFVAKLRELQETYKDFEQAFKEAVTYCINNGILVKFLKENGGKIMSILTAEYDAETHRRVYAEEKMEEQKVSFARLMLREGDPIDKIERLTGLPFEVIRKLQQQVQMQN